MILVTKHVADLLCEIGTVDQKSGLLLTSLTARPFSPGCCLVDFETHERPVWILGNKVLDVYRRSNWVEAMAPALS